MICFFFSRGFSSRVQYGVRVVNDVDVQAQVRDCASRILKYVANDIGSIESYIVRTAKCRGRAIVLSVVRRRAWRYDEDASIRHHRGVMVGRAFKVRA